MEGDFLAGQPFDFGDELAFAAQRGEAVVPVGAEVGEVGGGVGEQVPVALCRPSRRAGVIGLSIWARIDDQRQRSFVTGYPGRPPGFQDHEDIRGSMHACRRQRLADAARRRSPDGYHGT